MNDDDRRQMIEDAIARNPPPIEIRWLVSYPTGGTRFLLHVEGTDGNEYALKGVPKLTLRHRQRQPYRYYRELFIEQVVGVLARPLLAPVPPVAVINLRQSLTEDPTWMRGLIPGHCHGVRWIKRAQETRDISKTFWRNAKVRNRIRLGALAILLGWFSDHVSDFQLLVTKSHSRQVWSVDHGMLADTIPIWPDVKKEMGPPKFRAKPLSRIVRALNREKTTEPYSISEIRNPAQRLATMADEQIASAVAAPPESWRIGMKTRVELRRYLERRRDTVAAECFR